MTTETTSRRGVGHQPDFIAARTAALKPLRDKVMDAWKMNPEITLDEVKLLDPALKEVSYSTLAGWLKRWNNKDGRIGRKMKKHHQSPEEDIVVQCQNIVQAYLDKYVQAIDKVKALNKEVGQFRATLQEKDTIIAGLEKQIKTLKEKAKASQKPLETLKRALATPGD